MLGDFKKLFIEKPKSEMRIPQGILDSLSMNLPQGFHYNNLEDGYCILTIPSGTKIRGKLEIEGATIENLKKCKTFEDLTKYATNLQKPICMLPDEEGNFYLDNFPFSTQQIIKKPLSNIESADGILRYEPEPINFQFSFKIMIDEREIEVHIVRSPYNSLDKMRFVSDNLKGFFLSLIMNLSEPNMTVNVATDLQQAGSVENVIESIEVFNSFCKGEVRINGVILNKNNEFGMTPYDEDAVEYWKQLKQIEELFEVKFDVSEGIYEFDVIKVRELFRSLIRKEPFRTNEIITKLEGNGKYETTREVDIMVGKEMYFRFLKEEKSSVMGVELHYVGIKYIFGGKVKKFSYDDKTNKFETELEPAENTEMYTSTQYFLSEKDINLFLSDEDAHKESFINSSIIPKVRNA